MLKQASTLDHRLSNDDDNYVTWITSSLDHLSKDFYSLRPTPHQNFKIAPCDYLNYTWKTLSYYFN